MGLWIAAPKPVRNNEASLQILVRRELTHYRTVTSCVP